MLMAKLASHFMFFGALVTGLALSKGAFAFNCYIGEQAGDVILRKGPNDKADIVTHLVWSDMVKDIASVPERSGWVYVRASKLKGWLKHDQIRGECED